MPSLLPKDYLTLFDFLKTVKSQFDMVFGGIMLWCQAEVQSIKFSRGNYYLELVEFDSVEKNKVIAKVDAAIFQKQVIPMFLEKTGLKSHDDLQGQKILFQAMLSFHQERGFKVIINEISAEFTIGVLKQHQQDIAAILNQEGIFDKNKSRSLPTPSRNIAVITGENSQGFIDFETVLKESDYKAFNIIPFFCAIHGNNASDEVYNALKTVFNRISSGEKIDLVILLRGGGGGSGFVRQNAIGIARGICHMPVPVITAIGHTSDISILDDISRYSAKTPTDAAYKIIDSLSDREFQLESALSQISLLSRDIFGAMMQRVHGLLQNIKELVPQKILTYKTEITRTFETIMMLGPDKMLNRGYGLIMDENGKILKKEKSDLQEGQTLKIKRYDKTITVTVEEILNS